MTINWQCQQTETVIHKHNMYRQTQVQQDPYVFDHNLNSRLLYSINYLFLTLCVLWYKVSVRGGVAIIESL